MAEGLERSRGLEQQFLLSVSHDLRTPLTSIRGYAEAIGDGRVEPVPAAGVILSEAQRLERLVADLLDLARLDARRFRLDLRPADVGGIVAAAVEGFAAGGGADRRRARPRGRRRGHVSRSSTPIGSARWSPTCSTTGAGTQSAACG